jgi:hypothetical protein
LHGGAQVVEVDDLADAPERAEGVLETSDQVFGGLMKDSFTVSLAREAQDDA